MRQNWSLSYNAINYTFNIMEQRSVEVNGSSKSWEIPYLVKSEGPLKSNFKILELLSLKEKQTVWPKKKAIMVFFRQTNTIYTT